MKTSRLLAAVAIVLAVLALKACESAPGAHPATTVSSPPGIALPRHTAAIVADARDGRILYADHADRSVLIGSTAKLMTALIVLERVPLDATFVAPAYAGDGEESRMGLGSGERMQVRDLLRGLLLPSGNDAAMALAIGVAGSEAGFVELMNRRAQGLGMSGTRYGNPIGLDAGTRSTAADLVTLTRQLRRNAFFRATVAARSVTLGSGAIERTLQNSNRLLGGRLAVDGVKTGHTRAAGYVLVGSATRGHVAVISVVLGTGSEQERDAGTLALLRYGLRRAR